MKTSIRKASTATIGVLVVLTMGSCANMTLQEKDRAAGQVVGGVTGAALGSLIGGGTGRSIAIASGAVVGSVLGGEMASNTRR